MLLLNILKFFLKEAINVNGASEGRLTKREMIRRAFEALGYNAKPSAVAAWIENRFGEQVKTQTISVEKTWMKKSFGQGQVSVGTNPSRAESGQGNAGKVAQDALHLLRRIKSLADEVGGVERLRELLDFID